MAWLLTRYLRMYWLKPFDAVNDAANASALLAFPWEEPILEIGSGDGAFSFIMHDGEFVPADDRYDQVDVSQPGDMFDVHDGNREMRVRRPTRRRYRVGIDLKWSHLLKCRSTGLYEDLLQAAPAPLPLRTGVFRTVFLYFPHGLIERGASLDYAEALSEIRRVLRPNGTLLMLAMNEDVRSAFVCHAWANRLERVGWPRAAAYLKRLDAGRQSEIGGAARSFHEWRRLLEENGFELVDGSTQVSRAAWRVYDVQTRPLLGLLIRASRWVDRAGLKSIVKAVWVGVWWPVLAAGYLVGARPRPLRTETAAAGMVFAFRAVAGPTVEA